MAVIETNADAGGQQHHNGPGQRPVRSGTRRDHSRVGQTDRAVDDTERDGQHDGSTDEMPCAGDDHLEPKLVGSTEHVSIERLSLDLARDAVRLDHHREGA